MHFCTCATPQPSRTRSAPFLPGLGSQLPWRAPARGSAVPGKGTGRPRRGRRRTPPGKGHPWGDRPGGPGESPGRELGPAHPWAAQGRKEPCVLGSNTSLHPSQFPSPCPVGPQSTVHAPREGAHRGLSGMFVPGEAGSPIEAEHCFRVWVSVAGEGGRQPCALIPPRLPPRPGRTWILQPGVPEPQEQSPPQRGLRAQLRPDQQGQPTAGKRTCRLLRAHRRERQSGRTHRNCHRQGRRQLWASGQVKVTLPEAQNPHL